MIKTKYYLWLILLSIIIIALFAFYNYQQITLGLGKSTSFLKFKSNSEIPEKSGFLTQVRSILHIGEDRNITPTQDITAEIEQSPTVASEPKSIISSIIDNIPGYAAAAPTPELNSNPILDSAINISHSKELSNYRRHLADAQYLVINFLQDKSYLKQLNQLNMQEFPPEIKAIIEDFTEYDKNYLFVDNNTNYEKIFPVKPNLVERVIKITKKSDKLKNKEALKTKIISNLEIFINFIYSEESQNILMNKGK
ncbi:hypothetical protein Trichorick_00218 [Candidatus Trichorickettsia mobilis]|uniref:Uncharacterized protein n=1 Tax=Candidatus Trichorickettsia mobilis TaxID=1346319 RepID=A0ABZ0URV6_9RICK|nr:hypothetical protein [Candidatus Trichorickettsia mobilis]WPY00346.1 hypothetical protein Trichorick_00218 [Candidatus Trichorickettsia mobilis]